MDVENEEMIEAKRDLEMEKRALSASLKKHEMDDKLDEKKVLLNAQASFVEQTRLLEMEIQAAMSDLTNAIEDEKKQKQQKGINKLSTSDMTKSLYNPVVNPGGTVL